MIPPDDPRHGTRAGYLAGCQQPDCVTAHTRYTKRYRARRDLHGKVRVPSGRVRAHIQRLQATMSLSAIADAAGVSPTTVRELLRRPTVTPRIESKVLRVRPLTLVGTRHVTPVGTVRRMQALNALGYSLEAIAREAGISATWVQRLTAGQGSPWVESATAAAVARVFEAWSMKVPVGRTRFERGAITRVKRAAARKGFLPPLAWDDIDSDPAPAVPDQTVTVVDEAEWLAQAGESMADAASRLGYRDIPSFERLLYRKGRPDLVAALRGAA